MVFNMLKEKDNSNTYCRICKNISKIQKKGIFYCIKLMLEKLVYYSGSFLKSIGNVLENIYAIFFPSRKCPDSLLAIYDFSINPYTFNFVEFLARAETFRVKYSLIYIDLVFVVDRNKMHRGDQPEVTDSNYRNWILNLAECAEPFKSISSLSIFDNKHKFLSFYQKARHTHKIFPETGVIYKPQACYHLKQISDYYRVSGFVPKFEPSALLLDWAEKYFMKNSYPFVPVVILMRNLARFPGKNTNLNDWFGFMRLAIAEYPVKFFIVNDFWNPVEIPADLTERVVISAETTVSVKYRVALAQKSAMVIGGMAGSTLCCIFSDTPYLIFGLNNVIFNAKFHIIEHGLNEDLHFPWVSKYQMMFPEYGDRDYIFSRFGKLYGLLIEDGLLIPRYFDSHNLLKN